MSKTYYTQKGWYLAAVEDPRNPSFDLIEITIKETGDTLVIADEEYESIESCDEDMNLEGDEWSGALRDILDCVTIYKAVD
jgi:hypothetical protein